MPDVKTAKPKALTTIKRTFAEDRIIHSDLYKFEVEKMKRNVSWTEEPEYVDVEHCHFFHTFDSDGKAQTQTSPVGGHFHLVEVIPSEDPTGVPTVICKSGPMHYETKKVQGKYKKMIVPQDRHGVDTHTHEVAYMHGKSSTVGLRKMNAEAIKIIGAATKPKTDGVDLKEA